MSTAFDPTEAVWVKSSYSGSNGGQCVEFSPSFAGTSVVPVRDSTSPTGPALVFPASGWFSFVSAVKGGELPTV